jgi:hypothetical protein
MPEINTSSPDVDIETPVTVLFARAAKKVKRLWTTKKFRSGMKI